MLLCLNSEMRMNAEIVCRLPRIIQRTENSGSTGLLPDIIEAFQSINLESSRPSKIMGATNAKYPSFVTPASLKDLSSQITSSRDRLKTVFTAYGELQDHFELQKTQLESLLNAYVKIQERIDQLASTQEIFRDRMNAVNINSDKLLVKCEALHELTYFSMNPPNKAEREWFQQLKSIESGFGELMSRFNLIKAELPQCDSIKTNDWDLPNCDVSSPASSVRLGSSQSNAIKSELSKQSGDISSLMERVDGMRSMAR